MKADQLSPEKSLELITQVITQARTKFEENGLIYIFWGLLLAIASFSQFFLLQYGYKEINYYPYFIMPIGGILTGIYFSRKRSKSSSNLISNTISISWIALSLNIMILCFVFNSFLRENLIPVILILLSIGIITSGVTVKSRILIVSGLLINISAYFCFSLEWMYHPLLMGIISVVAVLIPGILLYKRSKIA